MPPEEKRPEAGPTGEVFWKEIPLTLKELLGLAAPDPSSDEDEGGQIFRQILKAYFDRTHEIVLEPKPGTSADPAMIDRHRFVAFLELTITLLRGIGGGWDLFNKLMTFSTALRDLDLGVTHRILKAKDGRKPPLSSETWYLRTILAIALDYLVRAKAEKLEDAARRVARTPGIEFLLSGRAKSADARKRSQKSDAYTSVIKWRSTLRRGKETNQIARMVWRASRENLANIDGPQGFRKEAEQLLGIARRELRTLTPGL
jgi:hypothetical protein